MMKKAETTKQNRRRSTGCKRKMLERIVSMLCLVLLLTVTIINDVAVAAKGSIIIGSVQSGKESGKETEEESQAIAETETESESETETENEAEATVLTYKKDGDYEIEVSYGSAANIPKGAELKVTEIQEGTEAYDTYLSKTLNVLAKENENGNSAEKLAVSFARYFDISFVAEDKEVEPDEAVGVKIQYAQPIEVAGDETVHTVHFLETQKEPEVLDTNTLTNDAGDVREVIFTQESFSVTGTVVTGTAADLPEDAQVNEESQNMIFVYYPQNTLDITSDSKKAATINTVKFTVNLLDKDGKITTLVPGTAEIPANIPDSFTTGPETTVAELLSHISVNGYTLEDGYAFFFWNGNAALSGGMDLDGAAAHSVKTIKNFTQNSDYYGAGAGAYGQTTASQVYGTIGYTMTDLGSDVLLNPGKTLTGYGSGNGDWNPDIDPSKKFYAYEYGGVLHIVLKPVTEGLAFKTNFFNYAESVNKVVDTTLCHDMEYVNNRWQGKLTMTSKEIENALTPPTADYEFDGWYDAKDDDGNGTGNKIEGGELQYSDKTVYARWVSKGETKPDDSFIKVQKIVAGISLADLPADFAINIYKNADQTELMETLTKAGAEQNGNTLTWKVDNMSMGTYYIEETGAAAGKLTVTPSAAGGTIEDDGLITVSARSPEITVNSITEITANSSTMADISDGYICASLTKNRGYFIWTAKTLSASEREALTAAITAKGSGLTVTNPRFYSSVDKLEKGINIDNAYIRISGDKLEFSENSIWDQVYTGTYTVDTATDAEISITNTYTTSLEVTKLWEPDDTLVSDDTVVKAAVYDGDNSLIQTVDLSKADSWTKKVTGLDPQKTYRVAELDANGNDVEANANINIAGQSYKVTYSDAAPQEDRTLKATITNTLNTSAIEITKADSRDETKKLPDAEFKIEKLVSGEGELEQYVEFGKANEKTDENGKATFDGLENGTYRITEVKAPDGYTISEAPQIITVDYKNNANSSGKITITVKNAAIYSLPATGGIGTYWFTFIGVSILMTAFLLLITNLKKRRI